MTAAKAGPALYVGEKIKVRFEGKVVPATVLEVEDNRTCVDIGDGVERWLSNSAIVR